MQNPQIILNHIAKSIQRKLDAAGYTSVDQFCKKNKIVKTTVYRAINDRRSPRLITLIQIANALKITLQELMDLEGIKTRTRKKK
ncbi:MAG: helix-turn-helix domain-containing protein [Fibrobacteraceae bacterium]|nr:helix-turn-helix domain-containing protein [Fibrobacteraceae bacterium]